MGNECCRGRELGDQEREHVTGELLEGFHERSVHLKVQELEYLAFVDALQGDDDVEGGEVQEKDREEGFFVDLLEKLETSDEWQSVSASSEASSDSGIGSDDSDRESCAGEESDQDELYAEKVGSAEEEAALEEWELANAWNVLRRREVPKVSIAIRLIRGFTRFYKSYPTLVHLAGPSENGQLVIVGDLHGHFGDLFHILDSFGDPSARPGGTQYLFNGDFVDRGAWGPEVLLTLFCLKLRFPEAVHFNRGNHEDRKQNRMPANGFRDGHCTRAFPKDGTRIYSLCQRSFGQLPLCHILGKEIIVIHGGLPLDSNVTLAEIQNLDRKRAIPANDYMVHGYKVGQKIKAKRPIKFEGPKNAPTIVARGTKGTLIARFKKTDRAIAHFDGHQGKDVLVKISGAPDLEEDVEIIFNNEEDKKRQRMDRLFVALMWSDPIPSARPDMPGPNSSRGAGYRFDDSVTRSFLRENHLRCLVRSHEKQRDGSCIVQQDSDGSLLAATVFSASNYPSGAGEPTGNRAAVLVVEAVDSGTGRSLALARSLTWREPFMEMPRWTGPKTRKSFYELTREVHRNQEKPTARVQVLQQLWQQIYCARPALLAYFHKIDQAGTGKANLADWVSAMRACVIADEDFPWDRVAPFLASFDKNGNVTYGAFLRRFQNVLSRRLEVQFCGAAMGRVLAHLSHQLGSNLSAEQEWAAIDRDGNGRVTYEEFRPLLREHSNTYTGHSAHADDDRAFALLASMDRDFSGFVDRDEFLLAVQRHVKRGRTEESETLERCWAALHQVLRSLARSRFHADAIFHAMDTGSDGFLQRSEFQVGLQRILHGSALISNFKDWEPLLWRLVDEDNSGEVTPDELITALSVVDVTHKTVGSRPSASSLESG